MSSWSKRPLNALEDQAPRSSDLWQIRWRGVELVQLRYGLVRYIDWPPTKQEVGDTEKDQEVWALERLREAVEKAAYKLIIARLARLARSRQQLASTLKKLQMPQAWIDAVLEKVVRLGAIDEASMSERVKERLKKQGKSKRQMELTLKAKGLPVTETISEEEELAAALAHLERWGKREDLALNANRYLQRLAQRGFEASIVYRAYEAWQRRQLSQE